jgi:hypothetical protein
MFRRVIIGAGTLALIAAGGTAALASTARPAAPGRPFVTVTAKPMALAADSSGGESVPCPASHPQPVNAAVSALVPSLPAFLPTGSSIHGSAWQVQAVNSTAYPATITVTVVCARS